MAKDFAYLTNSGIMHIADEPSAKNSIEKGVMVATDVENAGGYPVVICDGEPEQIIVYSEDDMKFEAKEHSIPGAKSLYPHLAELYRKCRG